MKDWSIGYKFLLNKHYQWRFSNNILIASFGLIVMVGTLKTATVADCLVQFISPVNSLHTQKKAEEPF